MDGNKTKKIMDQSASTTSTALKSAPASAGGCFSISTVFQMVPLVFLICLWSYVYNNGNKMNTSLIEAIYALAWITLIITFWKIYKVIHLILQIPNDKVKLALWIISTSVIVYMIVFLCIVIGAFSHQGKNATKVMSFLNGGSWVFFVSLMIVPFDMGVKEVFDAFNRSLDQSADFFKQVAGNAKNAVNKVPQLTKKYYDKLSNTAGNLAGSVPIPGF
jgi:hypothetical protein